MFFNSDTGKFFLNECKICWFFVFCYFIFLLQNLIIIYKKVYDTIIKKMSIFFPDICCRADTAEVELVSLIEEHIPHYKLRADTLTEFSGAYHFKLSFLVCY